MKNKNKINNSKLEIYVKGFKNFNKSMDDLSNVRGKKNILKGLLSLATLDNTSLALATSPANAITAAPAPDPYGGVIGEGVGLQIKVINEELAKAEGLWNKFNSNLAKNESQNVNYPTTKRSSGPVRVMAGYNQSLLVNIKNVYAFLENSFKGMSSLISKPIYNITSDKITIQLFVYYIPLYSNPSIKAASISRVRQGVGTLPHPPVQGGAGIEDKNMKKFLSVNNEKLNIICNILSNYFKKPVELELIQLKYPYYNSNIFVNFLGYIINDIKSRKIFSKLFRKAIIINPTKNTKKIKFSILPALLSGMKIKIAGRIMTNRVIPRKTINIFSRGALARGKVIFVDTARFTNKNKRGAYSISISTGQILAKI